MRGLHRIRVRTTATGESDAIAEVKETMPATTYLIIGEYHGKSEVIDEAVSLDEACYLVREYQLAYGLEWSVWYVEDRC